MQVSRIEQKIEDIYAFVESCKMQALSTTRVVVPKNELYDLLDDLRRDVPEEIKRYQKMLSQRDAILEDAEAKASAIKLDAQEQYQAMIEEHAIMQEATRQAELTVAQAQAQAEQILAQAQVQAVEIGNGAISYTKDLLNMAEKLLLSAYQSTTNNFRAMETGFKGYIDIIRQNKAELGGEETDKQASSKGRTESAVKEQKDGRQP